MPCCVQCVPVDTFLCESIDPTWAWGFWGIEKRRIRHLATKVAEKGFLMPVLCSSTLHKLSNPMWENMLKIYKKKEFFRLHLKLKTPKFLFFPPLLFLLSLPFFCLRFFFSLLVLLGLARSNIRVPLLFELFMLLWLTLYSYSSKEAYLRLSFPTMSLIEHNGNVTDT